MEQSGLNYLEVIRILKNRGIGGDDTDGVLERLSEVYFLTA